MGYEEAWVIEEGKSKAVDCRVKLHFWRMLTVRRRQLDGHAGSVLLGHCRRLVD